LQQKDQGINRLIMQMHLKENVIEATKDARQHKSQRNSSHREPLSMCVIADNN
jgi:hypothetical protein